MRAWVFEISVAAVFLLQSAKDFIQEFLRLIDSLGLVPFCPYASTENAHVT